MAVPSPGILYSAVQGKHSVSASRGGSRADVAELASKLLSQVDLKLETKKSYASKGYTFNYITERNTCFMCVADESFQRRICFAFLERVSREYSQSLKVSKGFLEKEMEFFSSNKEADKLRNVQKQVDEVKDIMMENIEKILERQEKLEEIDKKSEDLLVQS